VDTATEGGTWTKDFGSNIESATHPEAGVYIVNYETGALTVAGCAVVASGNEPGTPHFARGAVTGAKQVTVKTYESSNALANTAFSLMVTC
jgi:hypothetical protein